MKNKLTDLTDHLFMALEAVNEEGLKGDELRDRISRAGAVTSLSREIIATGRLALDAERLRCDHGDRTAGPRLLGLEHTADKP